MKFNLTPFRLAVALAFALGVHATANAQPKNGKRHSGPPPKAIAACEGAQEGDACTFNGRNSEEVAGTCMSPPEGNGNLACAPEGGAPPRPNQDK